MDQATTPGADGATTVATTGPDATAAGPAKLALEHIGYAAPAVGGPSCAILSDVTFTVPTGHVFTVLGPSGSGKSTLLRTIDRLVEPTRGRVLLDDRPTTELPVQELRRRVGMVSQAPALFNGTVLDNVVYGPRLRGEVDNGRGRIARLEERAEGQTDLARELACDHLRRVGLPPDFCDKPADQLSGGEAQRVCLARALANEPEVLLLDEPTASLDPAAARLVEDLLLRLAADTDLTFVFVTHDLAQARRIGDHGLLLVDGRVVEHGPLPGLFDQPDAEVTRLFLEGRLGDEAPA